MITICEKHSDIRNICTQRFYRGKLDYLEKEDLISIIEDMEGYFDDIEGLVTEAKIMGQSMEDGLRHRKEFMIEKGIEDEYQE